MKVWRPWWRRAAAIVQAARRESRTNGLDANRPEFGPLLVPDPRKGHRAVDPKWLTSLLLLAGAAVLLLGVLWNWLGSGLLVATAPEFSSGATGREVSRRADRLPAVFAEQGIVRNHVEQLDGDATGMKHFTFVLLRLVQAVDPFSAPATPAGKSVPSASMPAAPAGDALSVAAADETLPPEIRFGASRPDGESPVSAYADESPLPTAKLPGVPINLSVIGKSKRAVPGERHIIVARHGDTLQDMLTAIGVGTRDAHAIASLLTFSWFGRSAFSGGEAISVAIGRANGQARPLEVDIARNGRTIRTAVLADDGSYVKVAPRALAWAGAPDRLMLRPVFDGGPRMKLDQSFERLRRNGRLAPSLVKQITRLCAPDLERGAVIAPNDRVELLYSADAHDEPVLSFASLTLGGSTRRYYRFTAPDDGGTEYYNPGGQSVAEMLMKKPVSAGRLGDGFGWRIHPILHDRRFHEGVDYAAPFGSPIVAAGDGVLELISEEAGYGKFVRIRHDFGYETTYAHISSVPPGLKVGSRIRRGQTIAYVGSTGLSTGPHLYYELRVNGHNVDPLQANLRAGRVLDGGALAAFQKARQRTDRLVQVSEQAGGR